MSKTVDQVITRAFVHAQRKATPPVAGSPKYNALLAIADSMQKMWASEPDIEWSSRFELVDTGKVSATDTFDLDDSIQYITKREGDYIQLKSADGKQVKTLTTIHPSQLYRYKDDDDKVAQVGQTLVFSKAFVATDSVFGYSIMVPSYTTTDDITTGSQTVQVDDPMWLVYMIAAEYVRNDAVRAGQYDNLLTLAEQCMQKMKQANAGQLEEVITNWRPAGGDLLL